MAETNSISRTFHRFTQLHSNGYSLDCDCPLRPHELTGRVLRRWLNQADSIARCTVGSRAWQEEAGCGGTASVLFSSAPSSLFVTQTWTALLLFALLPLTMDCNREPKRTSAPLSCVRYLPQGRTKTSVGQHLIISWGPWFSYLAHTGDTAGTLQG